MSENNTREIAVQVSGVKKMYKLGQIGGGTLQADLQSWWARFRGKEDPNTKIGEEQRSCGDTFMALNGIDLTIYQGEAVGIIGGNGAGKSTLLKLLSRVTAPTQGEIDINGRIASMLEVGTGFNGELTGRENVYMNGAILGMTKAEIDAKMEQIIDFSEVREFIDTPVKRYSSGMFVKLAFSVAAHLDAEIMIMDEVLAVGDMAFQTKCLDKMREAAKEDGRTVLYVSHNMNTIRQLCDRCIVLEKGKVVFEGSVEESIAIYSGTKIRKEMYVDLSEAPREPEFEGLPGHILSFEVKNHQNSFFKMGDVVCGEMNFCCDKDIPKLFVRMVVKTPEGVSVTMLPSTEGVTVQKGQENRLNFEMDLACLVPGSYTLSPVLYEVDDFGNHVTLDCVRDVFCFDVLPTPGFNHNMEWSSRYWGHFYIGDLKNVTCTPV